jgi:hypothetical protein
MLPSFTQTKPVKEASCYVCLSGRLPPAQVGVGIHLETYLESPKYCFAVLAEGAL